MSERETELVAGTIGGIVQKGPSKWQIEITPTGAQYARKAWTKDAGVQAQAAALIGQVATFECGVSHWAKDDGTPVKSLWVNSIRSGTVPEATGSPVSPSEPSPQVQTPPNHSGGYVDSTQVSIERQSAVKSAVALYAALGPEPGVDTAGAVIAAAKRFASFIATGDDTPLPF